MALLALAACKRRVLARGNQFRIIGAVRIVAAGAGCFIKRLAVVRGSQCLVLGVVTHCAKIGLTADQIMAGLALGAGGLMVDVANLAAHFDRRMDDLLLQGRHHRLMAFQARGVAANGGRNCRGLLGRRGASRRLLGNRSRRQEESRQT